MLVTAGVAGVLGVLGAVGYGDVGESVITLLESMERTLVSIDPLLLSDMLRSKGVYCIKSRDVPIVMAIDMDTPVATHVHTNEGSS